MCLLFPKSTLPYFTVSLLLNYYNAEFPLALGFLVLHLP